VSPPDYFRPLPPSSVGVAVRAPDSIVSWGLRETGFAAWVDAAIDLARVVAIRRASPYGSNGSPVEAADLVLDSGTILRVAASYTEALSVWSEYVRCREAARA